MTNMRELTFERELESLLNRHSQENDSNTPDFILARYLVGCLAAWNAAVAERELWYGRPMTGGRSLTDLPPNQGRDCDAVCDEPKK